jgi:hypothetical protein
VPLTLRRGTVTAITERYEGLVRLEVDGTPCVAYPVLTGPVALGDDVLVNTQARGLGLGSGGFDVLHANLTRGLGLRPEADAHVMKLPYTPIQAAVRHGEEDVQPAEVPIVLQVVACTLHSQVAPVCAALRGRRVAYVQLPGGALPLALSDALRALREQDLVQLAIGAGPCFGGDVDCVNVHSALAVAAANRLEVAVCGVGPGIVGTGTPLGHGGIAAADAIAAAVALGADPILALRVSERDPRARHRGVSHHSRTVLALSRGSCDVAWPAGCPVVAPLAVAATEVDVSGWREACSGLPLDHMGRGPDEDPWFFAAAYAAGMLALGRLG